MTVYFTGAAFACLALAGWAAWMDRRRANRSDPDRVGWVSWPLVLVLALVGAMIMAILVLRL